MKSRRALYILFATLRTLALANPPATPPPDVTVETSVQVGGGETAPFWLVANRHGLGAIRSESGLIRAAVVSPHLHVGNHTQIAYGVDLVGAINHNAHFIVQQAYTDIRHRSLFLQIGSKEQTGSFNHPTLSLGSFTWSGNARPIPQLKAGFHDWVRPLRHANWFALRGEFSYGWFTDHNYQEKTVNQQYGYTTQYAAYHHKGIYFRFGRPTAPLLLEACYEIDMQFGGKKTEYRDGKVNTTVGGIPTIADFIGTFIPRKSQITYYDGNYVGSWQIKANYQITPHQTIGVGTETIFDDASGMGRANHFDGRYHTLYTDNRRRIVNALLIEYFQSTNQSGPLHWVPEDYPHNTNVRHNAPGADNYYNNHYHIGWSHWGQAMGNPIITSPAFNRDGWLGFKNNRVKSLHGGIGGWIGSNWQHRVMITYIKGWGTPFVPFTQTKESFCSMIELGYTPPRRPNWNYKISTAFDTGTLLGTNWGINFALKRRFK